MRHIQFCLDEIDCEIEALDQSDIPDQELQAITTLVSSMRVVLAGCAARRAARTLAMPQQSPLMATTADVPIPTSVAEVTKAEPQVEASPVTELPPPTLIAASNRNVAPPNVGPIASVSSTEKPANVIALRSVVKAASLRPTMRIAASVLLAVGLHTVHGSIMSPLL